MPFVVIPSAISGAVFVLPYCFGVSLPFGTSIYHQTTMVTKSGSPSPIRGEKPSWEFKPLTISLNVHGCSSNFEVIILAQVESMLQIMNFTKLPRYW